MALLSVCVGEIERKKEKKKENGEVWTFVGTKKKKTRKTKKKEGKGLLIRKAKRCICRINKLYNYL
jgi:hypothetical protein